MTAAVSCVDFSLIKQPSEYFAGVCSLNLRFPDIRRVKLEKKKKGQNLQQNGVPCTLVILALYRPHIVYRFQMTLACNRAHPVEAQHVRCVNFCTF